MTLLEMLVVLVVMSFVVTLVGQALTQVVRLEQILRGVQLDAAVERVRMFWLSESLESMLPVTADAPLRFSGNGTSLSGVTTAPPAESAIGIAHLSVRMTFAAERGVTELQLRLDSPQEVARSLDSPPPAEFRIAARWPGETGRFRYMDAQGGWHDQWPINDRDPGLLPRAVLVETGLADVPSFVVSVKTSPIGMPSRRSLYVP